MAAEQVREIGSGGPRRRRAEFSEERRRRVADLTREGNRHRVEEWRVPLDQYEYP